MTTQNKQGRLAIVDGIDGSGKTTQAELLETRIGFKEFHLPDYSSPTGKMIQKAIANNKKGISEEYFQSLMVANYVDLFDNKIRPLLDQGQNVVVSRAWDSMIAYSKSFGVSSRFIEGLVDGFKGYLGDNNVDYRVINIDIPVEVAMERISKRKGKKETIFENYQTLTDVRKSLKGTIDNQVDGTQPIESVYAEVVAYTLGNEKKDLKRILDISMWQKYMGIDTCNGSA